MALRHLFFLATAARALLVPPQRCAQRRLRPVRLVDGEMGFQSPGMGPLVSTGIVAVSFGWLRLRVAAYGKRADRLEFLLEQLQRQKVSELTSGDADASARVAETRRDVDAQRRKVEAGRTVSAFGVTGRLRVQPRAFDKDPEHLAAVAVDAEVPKSTLVTPSTAPYIVAAVLALTVPLLGLLAADPMAAAGGA